MKNCNDKFKNKDIVERCIDYSLELIGFIRTLGKDYINDTIGKQLLRSGTSIGANVVEAQACGSKKDFVNFLNHALKSANESKYWLFILEKTDSRPGGKKILEETIEISKILGSSIIKLRSK
jgi:four helix bundle protein